MENCHFKMVHLPQLRMNQGYDLKVVTYRGAGGGEAGEQAAAVLGLLRVVQRLVALRHDFRLDEALEGGQLGLVQLQRRLGRAKQVNPCNLINLNLVIYLFFTKAHHFYSVFSFLFHKSFLVRYIKML